MQSAMPDCVARCIRGVEWNPHPRFYRWYYHVYAVLLWVYDYTTIVSSAISIHNC